MSEVTKVAVWWQPRLIYVVAAEACLGALVCRNLYQSIICLARFSGWEPADSGRWNGFVQVLINVEAVTSYRVGTCNQWEVRGCTSHELVCLGLL